MDYSMPGFPVNHQLPELTQTHVHRVSDAIQPSHPLSSLLLPSVFPSTRVFSGESVIRIRGPKNWSFSINICPSKKYSGLISFRMGLFDLFVVQGTLKGFLQHHSSKASLLWHSAFFMIQLSYPYMATRKTIALTYGGLLAKWCVYFLIYCLFCRGTHVHKERMRMYVTELFMIKDIVI